MKTAIGSLTIATLLAAPLGAQDHDHGQHGQLGRVQFRTTCAPAAQQAFERGLAMVHSFWFSVADGAFRQALAADSTCGIAAWGLAVNYIRNPLAGAPSPTELAAGSEAAQRAAAIGARSALERDLIGAVPAFFRDYATTPQGRRLANYAAAMERVAAAHPEASEAQILFAMALVATAAPTDTSFVIQRRALGILNPLFAANPDHPGLAHYIIHAADVPQLAPLGLDAARRYAAIAPAAPHAQHMPSHIFIRLGMWEDNVAANRRSYEAGQAELRAAGRPGLAPHEYHAMDYMVYGLLQLGRDDEARRITAEATSALEQDLAGAGGIIAADYGRAAMQARMVLERGRWAEAAALPVAVRGHPTGAGVSRFARGIGAARSGAVAQARAEAASLDSIAQVFAQRNDPNWQRTFALKARVVRSWVALAEGDTARALAEAAAAADEEDVTAKHPVTPAEVLPARELQADMLMAVGRRAEAAAAYRAVLRLEPNRRRAQQGAERAGT